MKRVALFFLMAGLAVPAAHAQSAPWNTYAKELRPLPNIVRNQVQVLEADGDSLWSGPLLTVYLEEDDAFWLADEEPLTEGENVVFAIEADGTNRSESLVWSGLAFDTGGNVAGSGGFLVSQNGGTSFERTSNQLDAPSDTTVAYGSSTLPAAAITQQANSAPQDLAFGPAADTVWVAGVRSGIRWTADGGANWNRAVLPPDTSQVVDPTLENDFRLAPREDGEGFLNHVGYSVLVDETGTVWAGTAAGVNRSGPSDVTSDGDRRWQRYASADSTNSLTANLVVALTEQPRSGARNAIWVAAWAGGEQRAGRQRFGVTVTEDGGQTFRQVLIGERIYDLAAREERVYAAGETGLFVSGDRGATWRSVEDFAVEGENSVLPPRVPTRAVAVTDAALWVGTTEGLLRLDRADEPGLLTGRPRWRLFRTKVPVNPDESSEQAPDVQTYAYPNPFSPAEDQLVRIAYEVEDPGSVTIHIHDFAMNRIRTISASASSAGQHETVWDGTDDQGIRVSTGTYFYTVELGSTTVNGKILLTN